MRMHKRLQKRKHTSLHYIKRIIFSGVWITGLLLLLQVVLLVAIFHRMGSSSNYIMELMVLLGTGVLVYIINEKSEPAYKIAWIIPIMLFPLVGTLMYLYVKLSFGTIEPKRVLKHILEESRPYSQTPGEVAEKVQREDIPFAKLSEYIEKEGGYPTWQNTDVAYFPSGEQAMEPLLRELRKAEKFIFLEYYIVEEGVFWNQILEILEEKANAGVKVRMMYDDFGCVATLPRKYHKRLRERGIETRKYAALTPFLSTHFNNRDHRKMIIIDGVTAFSGGINLADEYINEYEKYGYWKDNGFLLRGDAVHNYTLMFLQMWKAAGGMQREDYETYLVREVRKEQSVPGEGFVIPYGDGPHQLENVAENVYMDIIHRARKYVYIMTPYLILDYQMQQTLMHAAKSGVDVRIIMPHMPDKRLPFYIARVHYPQLMRAGVKIYEYARGFVHSKTFLSDDDLAVAGSINLDFRSLYLHYECATLMVKVPAVWEIKKDFEDTFELCKEITPAYYYKTPIYQRMLGRVFRMFGPLM